ncbi:CASP-like protein 4A1 [Vigna radiata var. radiata]|uniref:CASP-like protein n=1 Tax=Vigna radiata var. radiata TaxID=3916 RepID=A0A1S3TTI3_VIGRR|nr:CASP-like protein 4A1 [Vigna radiata var. radiata]
MKKENSEEKATEPTEKVSGDTQEEQDPEQNRNEENQFYAVSEPSPSITVSSPSLRTHKSPSPPLHSLTDSPISDGHSSPHPQNPPPESSSDSSISDGHFSIADQRLSPPVVMAHRFQVEPAVVTKVDLGAEEGFVKDVEQATGAAGGNRRLRPDVSGLLKTKKIATWSKLLFGLRITAFVFCLASFSVLAADKKRGWALDSFFLYKEFRYSLSVNVIGFMHSGLQICDLWRYLATGKHVVDHQLWGYFTFALDQILTYLLMSSSSSAATRAYDWISNWGEDKFPYMANASVALSLVAFVAFALASLVSGSIIVRFR